MNILAKSVKYGGFPGGSDGKESTCNAGDPDSITGSGRSPGGGNGNSFQYSGLENAMGRGAWRATVHGAAKSRTRLTLSFHFFTFADGETNSQRALRSCSRQDGSEKISRYVILEKGTAIHSSFLAWRIPWAEEPGGLQSTGSQRVRHS